MKKGPKEALIIFIVVVAVVSVIVVLFMMKVLPSLRRPVFNIVSHNEVTDWDYDENLNPIYTMTVYVKIENLGIDGSEVVYCEVTREDLTTCTKSKNVTINSGAEMIIPFLFTNTDLNGQHPKEYRIWTG